MPRRPDASPQTLDLLAALVAEPDAWHYGYDLSRSTGLRSGTLYPMLIRLADRGWLETRWTGPGPSGRPPRHTYRLTPDGRQRAHERLAAANRRAEPTRPNRRPSGRPRAAT